MKRIILAALAAVAIASGAWAQYTMIINGTPFTVKCDAKTRTAEIVDNDYQPDENKYPIVNQQRKFSDMKHNSGKVLDIPAEYTAFGKTYRVTKIGRCAFADFQNVNIIYIPSTVTDIDEYAFFRCSAEEISVPATVKNIGQRAFGYCNKLKMLSLPAQLDFVGDRLYSESKKVVVTRSVEEDLVAAYTPEEDSRDNGRQAAPGKRAEKAVNVSTSAIDLNIPLNPTNNINTYAVIIANENYENEAKVDYAINDGISFRDYCKQTLGIPGDNIHFRSDATLNHLINELEWLENVDSEDASIIIYYAGHGIPDASSSTYLLPVDGNGRNTRTGFSLNELYGQLNEMQAQRVVVFLDACFSGTKRDGTMMEAARGGVAAKVKPQEPGGKVIVFSATQDDQTAHSYDEEKHGMFTYYLLEKMQQTQGNASLGELSEYVHDNVVKQSRKKNNKLQTPTVNAGQAYDQTWRNIRLR